MHTVISCQSSSSPLVSSTPTTPSHSPQSTHLEERLNSLLANFENGTHAFCREDRNLELVMAAKLSQATAAAAAAQKQAQNAERHPFLSLLSLSRPAGQTHFDPSREPKLHGLP